MNNQPDVLEKFYPHRFLYLDFYFFGLLAVVAGIFFYWQFLIFGILLIIGTEVFRKVHSYYLLHTGIAREYNFLSTSRKFAEYEKIQNIEVTQTFIQKILGVGSIKFDTPGSDLFEIHFDSIKNPYEVERVVRKMMIQK
ncbi:MAG: PH domain-containing protein [Candidatus Paceibacterota bacterium]